MDELAKKTEWIATDLGQEKWIAFPLVKLDGINEVLIIRTRDYKLVSQDKGNYLNPSEPSGVYLFRSAQPNNTMEEKK